MQESNTWAHFYSSSRAKDGQHVLGGREGMVEVNALSRAKEGVGSGGWGLTGEAEIEGDRPGIGSFPRWPQWLGVGQTEVWSLGPCLSTLEAATQGGTQATCCCLPR